MPGGHGYTYNPATAGVATLKYDPHYEPYSDYRVYRKKKLRNADGALPGVPIEQGYENWYDTSRRYKYQRRTLDYPEYLKRYHGETAQTTGPPDYYAIGAESDKRYQKYLATAAGRKNAVQLNHVDPSGQSIMPGTRAAQEERDQLERDRLAAQAVAPVKTGLWKRLWSKKLLTPKTKQRMKRIAAILFVVGVVAAVVYVLYTQLVK